MGRGPEPGWSAFRTPSFDDLPLPVPRRIVLRLPRRSRRPWWRRLGLASSGPSGLHPGARLQRSRAAAGQESARTAPGATTVLLLRHRVAYGRPATLRALVGPATGAASPSSSTWSTTTSARRSSFYHSTNERTERATATWHPSATAPDWGAALHSGGRVSAILRREMGLSARVQRRRPQVRLDPHDGACAGAGATTAGSFMQHLTWEASAASEQVPHRRAPARPRIDPVLRGLPCH